MDTWLILVALLGISVLLGWIARILSYTDTKGVEFHELSRSDLLKFTREAMRMQDEAHRAHAREMNEIARTIGEEIRRSIWPSGGDHPEPIIPDAEPDDVPTPLLFDWTDSLISDEPTAEIPHPPAGLNITPYEP